MTAEFTGQWVRRGGVLVPVMPDPVKKPGRKPRKVLFDWDETQLRAAHSAYVSGDRDLWTREGERLYNTGRKRIQSARLSKIDLEWAERDAVKWSWEVDTRTNRRVSMANR